MNPPYTNWDEATLRDAVSLAVDHAGKLGADATTATARAGSGVRIVVRDRAAETALRNAHQSLGLTVFRNGRSGSASTMALDPASIRRAADEAFAIAGYVQPDPLAGLADPDTLAFDTPAPPMLAPSGLSVDALLDLALAMEALAIDVPVPAGITTRVTEAVATSNDMVSAMATSAGFCRSSASSMHGRWAMVMAQGPNGSVQDYAESNDRQFDRMDDPAAVAKLAVDRTVGALGARAIASRRAPILFDARVAGGLIGDLVGALSGGPQYRRASFLQDALGRQIAAAHLDLFEDPFEPFGLASGGYDSEGVGGQARHVVEGGVACGYFLGTMSARRLGLRSTGNAAGPWNLRLSSRAAGGDPAAMRAMLYDGLVVTRLLGGDTDQVTGTWTQAVGGYWVEKGVIIHPVADITLAGTMGKMLNGIVAVGDDVRRNGAIRCGSILIDAMQIGGAA